MKYCLNWLQYSLLNLGDGCLWYCSIFLCIWKVVLKRVKHTNTHSFFCSLPGYSPSRHEASTENPGKAHSSPSPGGEGISWCSVSSKTTMCTRTWMTMTIGQPLSRTVEAQCGGDSGGCVGMTGVGSLQHSCPQTSPSGLSSSSAWQHSWFSSYACSSVSW